MLVFRAGLLSHVSPEPRPRLLLELWRLEVPRLAPGDVSGLPGSCCVCWQHLGLVTQRSQEFLHSDEHSGSARFKALVAQVTLLMFRLGTQRDQAT